MRLKIITIIAVLVTVINSSSPCSSVELPTLSESAKAAEHQGEDMPLIGEETEESIDALQEKVTSLVYETALWVDSFFDDDRHLDEENQTRGTLKLAFGYSRDDKFEIEPRVNIRLQLPKLENRAQIIISGAEDNDFEIDTNSLNSGTTHNDEETGELTAALRYFLLQGKKFNVSFDTGVSWTYVFASMRYRAIQDFGVWQGRFTNRLKWYSDDGWENKAAYDLERDFGKNFFFRNSVSAGVYEKKEGIPHGVVFKLFQVLSPLSALSYETGFYFGTDPDYIMTEAEFELTYRQRFYRDWLVLEIAPKISFPEENDYEINPGIIIKFEASFGYSPGRESYKKVFSK